MLEVEMLFGLTPTQIQSLPQMRNRPGCYSGTRKDIASVNTFYDWDSAKAAAIVAHGSKQAMDTHLSQASRERSERFEKDFADWWGMFNEKVSPTTSHVCGRHSFKLSHESKTFHGAHSLSISECLPEEARMGLLVQALSPRFSCERRRQASCLSFRVP